MPCSLIAVLAGSLLPAVGAAEPIDRLPGRDGVWVASYNAQT